MYVANGIVLGDEDGRVKRAIKNENILYLTMKRSLNTFDYCEK